MADIGSHPTLKSTLIRGRPVIGMRSRQPFGRFELDAVRQSRTSSNYQPSVHSVRNRAALAICFSTALELIPSRVAIS